MTPLQNLPLLAPAGSVLQRRKDNAPNRWTPVSDTLESGPPPNRIPRLWHPSLGSTDGVASIGYPSFFYQLGIKHKVPIRVRSLGASVSLARGAKSNVAGAYGDRLNIPATFIGWNNQAGRP
jgi:hypothetical protein